jgi:hypothetical protein
LNYEDSGRYLTIAITYAILANINIAEKLSRQKQESINEQTMNSTLKSFLKFIGLLIVVAVLGWYIGFLTQVGDIQTLNKTGNEETTAPIRKFPELQDPKTLDFNWTYQHRPYDIKLSLYKSVYDFYRSSPKDYTYYETLPPNWEEDYYGMFIKINPQDKTIPDLANQLKALGVRSGLTDDKIVELATAFVQAIPYDNERAQKIERNDPNEKPNYPYELLYLQSGVCSDKTFLLDALLQQMGYGTALFEYKQEKHIAVGIKCPAEDSTYDSGYCYTETTQTGHKIGVVPDISPDTNIGIVKKQIGTFDSAQQQAENTLKLGQVAIYQKTDGKSYAGIELTIKTQAQIDSLEKEIADLKQQLTPQKSQLDSASKAIDDQSAKMSDLKKSKDVASYNSMVPIYNNQVAEYKKAAGAYNQKVSLYNQKVGQYNQLIKQFYE